MGTINQKGFGGYFSFRMNFQDFDKTVIYDYDPTTNYVDGGIWDNDDIEHNGLISQGKFVMNIGLTKKIFNPLWIYSGIGFNVNTYYNGIDKLRSDGTLYESDWAKNTELSKTSVNFEAGLQLNLWILNLRYGISHSGYYGTLNTFGIGFSQDRY